MPDLAVAITFIIMIGCAAVALIFINSEGFLFDTGSHSVDIERVIDNSPHFQILKPRIWTSDGEIY